MILLKLLSGGLFVENAVGPVWTLFTQGLSLFEGTE
jgi:hypothetical protein